MNKKSSVIFVIGSLCLNAYADQTISTPKQQTKPKSVETTNNNSRIFTGKVKVVNGYEVAASSTKGIEIKEDFLERKKEAEKTLQKDQEKLIATNKELQAQLPTLNESSRREKEKEIAKMDRELKEKAQDLKEKLESHMYLRTEELGQEFEKIVQEYGKDQDLDLIIDKSSGRPVYVAKHLECTDDIVLLMNKSESTKKSKTVASTNAPKSSNQPVKKTT